MIFNFNKNMTKKDEMILEIILGMYHLGKSFEEISNLPSYDEQINFMKKLAYKNFIPINNEDKELLIKLFQNFLNILENNDI